MKIFMTKRYYDYLSNVSVRTKRCDGIRIKRYQLFGDVRINISRMNIWNRNRTDRRFRKSDDFRRSFFPLALVRSFSFFFSRKRRLGETRTRKTVPGEIPDPRWTDSDIRRANVGAHIARSCRDNGVTTTSRSGGKRLRRHIDMSFRTRVLVETRGR